MAEEAPKQAEGGTEEEGGKKKLPIWVLILIGSQVLLLVVALVVFKMMMGGSSHEEEHATTEETKTEHEAEQKVSPEKISDPKTLSGPMYKLESFVVNLIDDGRGAKYLKAEIQFELEEEAVQTEIEGRLSQIRDELLTLLSSKRQTDIETSDGKRILKDEIFTRMNKILVTGRIKRVFFTEFVVQ